MAAGRNNGYKGRSFRLALARAGYYDNCAEKTLHALMPLNRAEGHKLHFCLLIIPCQSFSTWAPHGPKFLHVNPTMSCYAFFTTFLPPY